MMLDLNPAVVISDLAKMYWITHAFYHLHEAPRVPLFTSNAKHIFCQKPFNQKNLRSENILSQGIVFMNE